MNSVCSHVLPHSRCRKGNNKGKKQNHKLRISLVDRLLELFLIQTLQTIRFIPSPDSLKCPSKPFSLFHWESSNCIQLPPKGNAIMEASDGKLTSNSNSCSTKLISEDGTSERISSSRLSSRPLNLSNDMTLSTVLNSEMPLI
jgi:hypothetical protein